MTREPFPRGLYGGRQLPPPTRAAVHAVSQPTQSLETLTNALIFGVVVMFCTISGYFLEARGISYMSPGGNFLMKMHPGTYIMSGMFGLLALALNPVRFIVLLWDRQGPGLVYTVCSILLFIWVVVRHGTSGTAFMIDCLIVPGLLALSMAMLTDQNRDRLYITVMVLMGINAVIGIGEFLTRTRLTPFTIDGVEVVEPFFRPTALLGHPLQNALMTSMAFFTLPALRDRPLIALPLAILFPMALFSFGGRTAMVITAGMTTLLGTLWYLGRLFERKVSYVSFLGALGVVLGVPMAAGLVLSVLGSESRLVQEFYWDTSAQSRLLALRIFDQLTAGDILFGIGPTGIIEQVQVLANFTGIIGIENGWLLLLLHYGLFGFVVFIVTLTWFLLAITSGAPAYIRTVLVVFILIASSNNSLAAKDSSLILLVLLAYGATCYERRQAARAKERQAREMLIPSRSLRGSNRD
ncbi:MAG: hypothetical protein EAZ99_09180 [Alphaproteobacteria bacterium]|nr:MAG: hypothetical protein EAZ99_09180 [Alphaproteobacteria bacterium]